MARFRIPYGRTHLTFTLSDALHTELIAPAPIAPVPDAARAVMDALDAPLDFAWEKFAHARPKGVAIAINDKTRPVPLAILLPPLLARLTHMGIVDDAITLIIATGAHTPMRPDEFANIVPADALRVARHRVICHDCDDRANLVELGTTTRGTRVWANRVFMQADFRIALGDIEPHQFMGFSGGVKSAAIGLAARETITHNHAMMLNPRAQVGKYDDNPARQDAEEIGKMMGVHFALNAVIDEEKQIVGVFAGDPVAVMRAGMPLALDLYRVRVSGEFDLMIVSPGGHPKDINLYQAQKALAHATPVVRKGGTVILTAACPEGSGSKLHEEYMHGMTAHEQVLERFKCEPFRLGYHKAFQIARDATRVRLLMVSEMSSDLMKRLLLTRCDSLDDALAFALRDLPCDAHVGVMPVGNVTIPTM
jgi:nickel-dependent lactate racemase